MHEMFYLTRQPSREKITTPGKRVAALHVVKCFKSLSSSKTKMFLVVQYGCQYTEGQNHSGLQGQQERQDIIKGEERKGRLLHFT